MAVISVRSDADIHKARRAGREEARRIGFGPADCVLIEMAVSELASNIVRYAGEGMLTIGEIEGGIEVVSDDRGPGIGTSSPRCGGGLGIGLNAVRRAMHQVEVNSAAGGGTKVVARRWMVRPRGLYTGPRQDYHLPSNGLMEYGVASIPAIGQDLSGDTCVIREQGRRALIAVIDGLGHGDEAYDAAQRAACHIEGACEKGLTEIIEGCHGALHGTRGAVIGIARVDMEEMRFSYAGIGNIRARVAGSKSARPISMPGVVGQRYRKVREESFPFDTGSALIIHSDGVSDRFEPEELEIAKRSAAETARHIVRNYGKEADDRTVVVAKGR